MPDEQPVNPSGHAVDSTDESAPDPGAALDEVRARILADDPTLEDRLALAFADALAGAHPEPSTAPLVDRVVAATAALTSEVPTLSRNAAMAATKRAVRQLTSWYHDQVIAQLRVVDDSVIHALRDLDRRIHALEVESAAAPLGGRSEQLLAQPEELPPAVAERAVAMLRHAAQGIGGRVLHAEAAAGATVRLMRDAGFDAYGVDPWLPPSGVPTDEDIWRTSVLDHLRTLPDGSLSGAVLSDIVDTASIDERLDVLRALSGAVRDGGVIVVVTEAPASDAARPRTGRRDLRPGRPFATSTWRRLLGLHGAAAAAIAEGVTDGERDFTVIAAIRQR